MPMPADGIATLLPLVEQGGTRMLGRDGCTDDLPRVSCQARNVPLHHMRAIVVVELSIESFRNESGIRRDAPCRSPGQLLHL